ncbi:hypothetical protein [Streptomyces sp. NPDC008121]|uniref:hypothetical protein n=1 Tax=Streptomyces sp. NPDC008121 TaxID=3364809 RepID=UPI0036E20827
MKGLLQDGDDVEERAEGGGGPGIEEDGHDAGGGGGEREVPESSGLLADCILPRKAGSHTTWRGHD